MEPSERRFARTELRQVDKEESVCNFLGAGFSAATAFLLPVATGFLDENCAVYCRDLTEQPGAVPLRDAHPELHALLLRLQERFGPLCEANLENVMTDLHIRAFGLGQTWADTDPTYIRDILGSDEDGSQLSPGSIGGGRVSASRFEDWKRDYEQLLTYVTLRLRENEVREITCHLTERFVRTLNSRDSIVTLNYDTIIERHLCERQRRGSLERVLGPPRRQSLKADDSMFFNARPHHGEIAKLHGSVDWVTCSNESCANHSYIQPTGPWYEHRFPFELATRCRSCGFPPAPVIIPPTAAKQFDRFPQLAVMWLRAYHALRVAPRWTFIGVSFAPTDFHLAALLRAASFASPYFGVNSAEHGQICIVNRSFAAAEEAASRLVACLSPDHQAVVRECDRAISLFSSVDEYVDAVERVDQARFCQASEK